MATMFNCRFEGLPFGRPGGQTETPGGAWGKLGIGKTGRAGIQN